MIAAETLLAALGRHAIFDSTEGKHVECSIELLANSPRDWWRRTRAGGHVTASAWVTDAGLRQALLLHHAKIGRWLQPGGHIDENDLSPAEAALREAREESGIASLTLLDGRLFDVDVHAIPARGQEAAHLHYDMRYRVIAAELQVSVSNESLGFRWADVLSLCGDDQEPGIARMARKSHLSHEYRRSAQGL
ncbi:MAG: NUDIX hydrolase [Betaproteobacteria bacterium]|nr:NUDIX hydrolase [Betaproteobacteria bacterium]